jgi:hypothetical protein
MVRIVMPSVGIPLQVHPLSGDIGIQNAMVATASSALRASGYVGADCARNVALPRSSWVPTGLLTAVPPAALQRFTENAGHAPVGEARAESSLDPRTRGVRPIQKRLDTWQAAGETANVGAPTTLEALRVKYLHESGNDESSLKEYLLALILTENHRNPMELPVLVSLAVDMKQRSAVRRRAATALAELPGFAQEAAREASRRSAECEGEEFAQAVRIAIMANDYFAGEIGERLSWLMSEKAFQFLGASERFSRDLFAQTIVCDDAVHPNRFWKRHGAEAKRLIALATSNLRTAEENSPGATLSQWFLELAGSSEDLAQMISRIQASAHREASEVVAAVKKGIGKESSVEEVSNQIVAWAQSYVRLAQWFDAKMDESALVKMAKSEDPVQRAFAEKVLRET